MHQINSKLLGFVETQLCTLPCSTRVIEVASRLDLESRVVRDCVAAASHIHNLTKTKPFKFSFNKKTYWAVITMQWHGKSMYLRTVYLYEVKDNDEASN